jgi:hypothetical protein
LIPGIPGIVGRDAGIGRGGQIAIEIVRLRCRAKCQLLVARVVVRRGESRWDIRPSKRAAGFNLKPASIDDQVFSGGPVYDVRAEYEGLE